MKAIPDSTQNCNHWLQNRSTNQILNPSISTDLENRQNSSASLYAKTLCSRPLLNCLRTAETNEHVSNPSNSMALKLNQNYAKYQNQANLQPLVGEINLLKNLLIIAPQLPEACRDQLTSFAATDDNQPEVEI